MKVSTTRFGEIEINKEEVILFSDGLLGFEEQKKYVLLPTKQGSPLFWLQSLEEPSLAFVVTEPWVFVADYNFDLAKKNREDLEIEDSNDVRVLCLVVIPNDIEKMTLNLKGPLVINIPKRLGQQVVITQDYSTKHPAFAEIAAPA